LESLLDEADGGRDGIAGRSTITLVFLVAGIYE